MTPPPVGVHPIRPQLGGGCGQPVGAAGYARGLLRHVRSTEPWALADRLVAGAYIEARPGPA